MQLLSDPLNNRKVKQVTAPPHRPLLSELFFVEQLPNWQLIQSHLYKQGRILKKDFLSVIKKSSSIMNEQPNLLALKDPVTIVGDIHGQFYDLVQILRIGGIPQNKKYIFMGDYVDRGIFSIQVLILLYSMKCCYPKNIYLLRGNHQSRQLTSYFNFRLECLIKYDQQVYQAIMESFDRMPVACVLNNNFFIVHGGISPYLKQISEINLFNRRIQPSKEGVFCDLLWSDPNEKQGKFVKGFANNQSRGCSYFFNNQAVASFLQRNKLVSLIRAHQAQIQGFKMHWPKTKGLPLTITLFSAPNYCDCYKNKGAVINFKSNLLNIKQFNYSQHPYFLPNFMNLFQWSIPFVAQKVSYIYLNLLKGKVNKQTEDQIDRTHTVKNKVKAITRMMILHKSLKSNSEKIIQMGGLCPDDKLPIDTPLNCEQGKQLGHFQRVQHLDKMNEKVPTL